MPSRYKKNRDKWVGRVHSIAKGKRYGFPGVKIDKQVGVFDTFEEAVTAEEDWWANPANITYEHWVARFPYVIDKTRFSSLERIEFECGEFEDEYEDCTGDLTPPVQDDRISA